MRDGIVGLRGKDMGLCATGLRVTHDRGMMGLCGRPRVSRGRGRAFRAEKARGIYAGQDGAGRF